MSNEAEQWQRREGYGGPESFPEQGLAEWSVAPTTALDGRAFDLHLADGRVLNYAFAADGTLSVSGAAAAATGETRDAREPAPGLFFVRHGYADNPRLTTCLVLDTNRDQVVVVDGEIPAAGDTDFRVRKQHVGGCIGAPATEAAIQGPPFPPDLVGKRFVASYSQRYAWEVIYVNDHRVAWHGLKGNPGIGDVEVYHANQFAPDLYVVSWSEDAETLAAVFVYNLTDRTITGHMWGYAPELDKLLHAPLGGRIVDSAEFGIQARLPAAEGASVQARNKDVVLRQHYEVWNQAKYDLIDDIYTEDFACHFIDGLESTGREALLAFVSGHRTSFPDWTEKVVDIVAEGDRVVTRYESTGTHEGEFQGIAPTGRRVTVKEVSIYRLEDGRIAEQWGFPDGLSLYHQLT